MSDRIVMFFLLASTYVALRAMLEGAPMPIVLFCVLGVLLWSSELLRRIAR